MGTAALVLGIVGAVFAFLPFGVFIALPLGVLALVFGLIGWIRGRGAVGGAIAGVVLGIAAVAIPVVALVQAGQEVADAGRDLAEAGKNLANISSPAGPAPRQAPPGRTILDLTGDGPKQTDKFTVSGDWHVQWSYDCTKTDTPVDSLVVQVLGGNTEIPVTHLGPTGADTQAYHDAGTFYLSVSSNCSWHVVVTG
ncbi:hypothetical protein GCM10029964_011260 [Kibdelosporangium lantanae]